MCSKVNEIIDNLKTKKDMVIVEGHLAHYCEEADLVIVLRAHPSLLKNIEAEALDVCAFEAFQIHNDKVNEIDTSYKNPLEVRDLIIKVINGEEHFLVGKVDFLDYLDL